MLIAVACWVYSVDFHAAAAGYDFSPNGWVMRIVLRDIFICMGVAGVWDWVLYFSPLKERMAPYKFNKAYPPGAQLRRDMMWTFSASLLSSVQEVLLMRFWASGAFTKALFGAAPAGEASVPWDAPFFGTAQTAVFSLPVPLLGAVHFHAHTLGFLLWTVSMLYWRIAHFHTIHRGMHPWWNRKNGLAQVRGTLTALYTTAH